MAENEPAGGLTQANRTFIDELSREFPRQFRASREGIQQSLEQGRAANSALMEFLNSQRGTGPSPLLQLASGLLRPTRAGGFGESLAAGAEGYAGALQQQRQGELDRAMRIQQLQAATANLGLQANQQLMALMGQGMQLPATLAGAYGSLADLGLLGGETPAGTPTTRTQLAVPGALPAAPMPAAGSPLGPQPRVTQTPLPPTTSAAGGEEGGGPAIPMSPSVDAALNRMRTEQGATQPSEPPAAAAPAAPPAAAAPAPAAAPAGGAPAPAAGTAGATDGATGSAARPARSTDPMVARAQSVIADAAANPSRYAGPQGRALLENARRVVRESPEGQAEITLAQERAKREAEEEDAANEANRRFMNSTAEQQARAFQELATGAGEATQSLGRLQQLEAVMRDLPSGVPGWFVQQAARLGLGPQATQYEVATALLKQLIPAQRQGMPGAVSDFDARNFEASLPRLMSTPDGRRMVTDTLKSVAEYQVARGRVAMQAQNGEITRQEALRQLSRLPSPFERFNEYQERFAAEQAQQRPSGSGQTPAVSNEALDAELRRRGLIR